MSTEQVITFGCRLNTYESEVIGNILKEEQLDNVVVFNTCCVTDEAEKQAVQAIRKHKRENPATEIIVTGCAVQINPRKYSTMPEVARVVNNKEKLFAKSYIKKSKAEVETPFLCGFEIKPEHLCQFKLVVTISAHFV